MKSEIRVAEGVKAGAREIFGYAAVWNSPSDDLGGFTEQIQRGAFRDSIADPASDVKCLFNHDPSYVLGRQKNGTLRLEEDAKGLRISCTPPDTQWARDLCVSIRRGDISQMSFAFKPLRDSWQTVTGGKLRTLIECKLGDVSVVTNPAYQATSVQARNDECQGLDVQAETERILADLRRRLPRGWRVLMSRPDLTVRRG